LLELLFVLLLPILLPHLTLVYLLHMLHTLLVPILVPTLLHLLQRLARILQLPLILHCILLLLARHQPIPENQRFLVLLLRVLLLRHL